ncbi:MAG TPA: hypothetical protein VGG33_26695 [Polyangia bacterium]
MPRKGETEGRDSGTGEGRSGTGVGRSSKSGAHAGGKRGDAFGVNAGSAETEAAFETSSGSAAESSSEARETGGESGWAEARVRATEVVEEISQELMNSIDLRGRVDRNPYGVMATAVGIGFVLGGGLFSRFTGRIVAMGVRMGLMAALPAVQKQLWAAALGQLDQPEDVTNRRVDRGDDEGDEAGAATPAPDAT